MEDAARVEMVAKLVGLQRADWKYADLYARAAEAALTPVCTREQFEGLRARRSRVTQLISELERAIRRGDWNAAEKLAEEGRELRVQVERDRHFLSLAEGPGLCEDLGLDPTAYRITCIPFDVYERLASRYGWGAQPLWTHFDGYQLTRELELQALVGGDVRYGGADDLCGVGRGYDSDHITTRFAIVRRDRFEARAAHEPLAAE